MFTNMAGVVPFSGGAHGRKQWNIRDKKSGRRLRSQLAEDGCPESQLVLAKQLLQGKSVISLNNEENARLGVFWLIKASEQGNVEATDILRQCLETGEGITEHNYLDVKACLNTSQNEKLAKRAAREMFLSLSAGQDFITLEQLRRKIQSLEDLQEGPSSYFQTKEGTQNVKNDCLEAETKFSDALEENGTVRDEKCNPEENIDWSAKNENFGEKLTEDHLESAATHYSRGELPLVQRVFALTDPMNSNMENLNYLQRMLLHPLLTVQQTYVKVLNHFSSHHRHNLFILFPGSAYVHFLVIFLLYPLINIENLLLFLPMCIYYVSFFIMVISTLQMLHSKKEYRNFRVWSRLFLKYDRDGNLNTEDAEFEFCKKNLRPYGIYFLNLLLNLVAYPFISELWIPQSEFAIIAFFLTFTTLYSFHDKTSKKLDLLLLFSFAINVVAKYPYETDGVVRQTWRFLDIELPILHNYGFPCFASQIVGSGVEFCLNFRGVFYLFIPGIFLKMASRDNWRGTYKILIPHCVTLSWWQIAVFCCQGATFYGLLRSTLALVGLVFFIPLVGIALLVLPVVAIFKHFVDAALSTKTAISILLASVPIAVGYYKQRLHLRNSFVKIQIVLAIISALFLLSPLLSNSREGDFKVEQQTPLTWEQFSSVCQRSPWDKRSHVEIQHSCVYLNGAKIHWEGRVDNVRIVNVENNLLKVLDNMPGILRSQLLCYFGEEYKENCLQEEDETNMRLCKIITQVHTQNKCHVNSWNKYEFEISLKISSDKWSIPESTVQLIAEDSFKNFSLKLQPKDRIWFTGVLNRPETIGSDALMISAEEVGCISCYDKDLTSAKIKSNRVTSQHFGKEIYNGFKRILNFVCNPVVNFR